MQTTGCNCRVLGERGEDGTVYFAAQSVPSFSACGGQRLFPYPHVGPLLQPAQAGRFRVRVPSPAPPPASFHLSQLSSSSVKEVSATVPIEAPGNSRHSLTPVCLRHLQQFLPWTGGTWVSLPSLALPALLNLDSGEHPSLSNIPADSPQLWEKQKWERQAVLIGTSQ